MKCGGGFSWGLVSKPDSKSTAMRKVCACACVCVYHICGVGELIASIMQIRLRKAPQWEAKTHVLFHRWSMIMCWRTKSPIGLSYVHMIIGYGLYIQGCSGDEFITARFLKQTHRQHQEMSIKAFNMYNMKQAVLCRWQEHGLSGHL